MHVKIVEISHPDKRHPKDIRKHNHILIGYTKTLCGHQDFNGLGVEAELEQVPNLCVNCRKLANVQYVKK